MLPAVCGCSENKFRYVRGDGSVEYREGDVTLEPAGPKSRCNCGFKHFYNGKFYDNRPREWVFVASFCCCLWLICVVYVLIYMIWGCLHVVLGLSVLLKIIIRRMAIFIVPVYHNMEADKEITKIHGVHVWSAYRSFQSFGGWEGGN